MDLQGLGHHVGPVTPRPWMTRMGLRYILLLILALFLILVLLCIFLLLSQTLRPKPLLVTLATHIAS